MLKKSSSRMRVVVVIAALLSAAAFWVSISGDPELQRFWDLWPVVLMGCFGAILALFFALAVAVMETDDWQSRLAEFLVIPMATGIMGAIFIPFWATKSFDQALSQPFLWPFLILSYLVYLGAIWVNRGVKGAEQAVDWEKQ